MARRRGRIARLPKDVRDEIKLQDGVVYREIAEWLASLGHTDIGEDRRNFE